MLRSFGSALSIVGALLVGCADREPPAPPTPAATAEPTPTGHDTEPPRRTISLQLGAMDADVSSGTKDGILEQLRGQLGRPTSCVEQAAKASLYLDGEVSVGFRIATGRVADVHLVQNTTGDETLGKCLVISMRTFRFPEEVTSEVRRLDLLVSVRGP